MEIQESYMCLISDGRISYSENGSLDAIGFLDNEANLSLIAEKWKNPDVVSVRDIVFVYVSEESGAVLCLTARFIEGAIILPANLAT